MMATIEAVWFDAQGKQVSDPTGAVSGEITVTADTGEVTRTYFDRRPASLLAGELPELMPSQADWATPEVFDMTSNTWDLWVFGNAKLVTTLAELLDALGLTDKPVSVQRAELCLRLELPSWTPAPQSLKDEVYAFLVATRGI